MCEGTDTTSSTLIWLFAYLANHPKFQDMVVDHFKKNGVPADAQYLDVATCKNNPYLEACLWETLRMFTEMGLKIF